MKKLELQSKIELYRRELAHLESIQVGCESCDYFSRGLCDLAQPPMRPPAEIIPVGCPQWEWDHIPF